MKVANRLRGPGPWFLRPRAAARLVVALAAGLVTIGGSAAGAGASAIAAITVTGPASYTVTWRGQTVSMALTRDTRINGLPVGQAANFQTNDPTLACYDGQNMAVYAHQPGWPANDLVVRARDAQCPRKSAQWVFTVLQQGLSLAGRPSHIGWWQACVRARGRALCRWVDYGRGSRLQARLTLDGRPQAGATVTFATPPADTQLGAGSCVTDASGRCGVTFAVYQTPSVQTQYTLQANYGSLSTTASVAYGVRPATADIALSARATPIVIGWVRLCANHVCRWAYQGTMSRITARVRSTTGPATGVPVTFSTGAATGVSLSSTTCTTDSTGACSVRLRVVRPPLRSKTYTIVARAAGKVARAHVEYGARPHARATAAGA